MGEKAEDVGKVCRLCGQFESIYIDVFGEEGTRRLLGRKIHSKINILMKKEDDLPTAVCIRCIGILEFVCDFHDTCHETQRRLQKEQEEQLSISKKANGDIRNENSTENPDKENVSSETELLLSARKVKKSIRTFENTDEIPPSRKRSRLSSDKVLGEISTNKYENSLQLKNSLKINDVSSLKLPMKLNSEILNSTTTTTPVAIRTSLQKFIRKSPDIDKTPKMLKNSLQGEGTEFVSAKECNISLKNSSKSLEGTCTMKTELIGNESERRQLRQSTLDMKHRIPDKKSTASSAIGRTLLESSDTGSIKLTSSKRKKTGSSYGTISELISPEEKEAIESFYTIDMSAVDERKVNCHLNSSLDKNRTVCGICDASYVRADKCRVHIWAHLGMKPYKCKACDFCTVTVSNIRCHIRKSHLKIKPFECKICHKRYVTAVLLDEHMNTHSGKRPFKCKFCTFASASRQVLNYHMTTHKTVKDVPCEICDKKFFSKSRMRAHMYIHDKNENLMCKYCSQHFKSTESLQNHHDNVHSKDYICNVCDKITKSRKALANHLNVHLEAKYKCTLCPSVYKSSHILKEHLLKHEGIRKYKCQICTKSFAQQSHLAAHMAVHSDKRFNCPGCNKAFNRHDNMKSHTKKCVVFNANPDLKEKMKRRKDRNECDTNEKGKKNIEMTKPPLQAYSIGQVTVIPISERVEDIDCGRLENMKTISENVIGLDCF